MIILFRLVQPLISSRALTHDSAYDDGIVLVKFNSLRKHFSTLMLIVLVKGHYERTSQTVYKLLIHAYFPKRYADVHLIEPEYL